MLTTGTNVTAFTGGSAADIDGGAMHCRRWWLNINWILAGSNGQASINAGAANTFTALQASADTIDVTISATDANCIGGILRVYAVCLDISSQQTGRDEVDRDLLA